MTKLIVTSENYSQISNTEDWQHGITEIVYQQMDEIEVLLFQYGALPETLEKASFTSYTGSLAPITDLLKHNSTLHIDFSVTTPAPALALAEEQSSAEKSVGQKRQRPEEPSVFREQAALPKKKRRAISITSNIDVGNYSYRPTKHGFSKEKNITRFAQAITAIQLISQEEPNAKTVKKLATFLGMNLREIETIFNRNLLVEKKLTLWSEHKKNVHLLTQQNKIAELIQHLITSQKMLYPSVNLRKEIDNFQRNHTNPIVQELASEQKKTQILATQLSTNTFFSPSQSENLRNSQ